MVHIIEHRGGAARIAGEEVASSVPPPSQHHPSGRTARTPQASRRHVPHMAAPVVQQCASSQPAAMGPLSAARELLRNPPGAEALPSAMAQWQADVDQLIQMAQVAPGSSRAVALPLPNNASGSQRRRHGNASASMRSPSVRGAPTEDLRAELNRRHARAGTQAPPGGAQEHQRNLEGRNLDPDFAVVQQKSPGAA
jgi:hypothetical protein